MDSPCRHFITQWFLTLFWFLHPLTYPQNSRSPAYTTRPLVSNNSYTCWATNNAHGNKLLITFEITNAQNCLVVFGDLIIKKLPSVNMSSYEASFATFLQFLATSGSASTVVKNPSTTVSSVKIWHYIMWRHNAYAAKSHFFYHPTKQAHVVFERTIRHIFSWSRLLFSHIPQNHCFWFTYLQSHQLSWSTHLPKSLST